MAKLIIINSKKGESAETHEDVFKLSNLLNREIFVVTNEKTNQILRTQTFYTVLDIENVPNEKEAFDLYNTLFPTSIFKNDKEDFLFGSCSHVLDNVIHYSSDLFDSMSDNLQTYLPKMWRINKEFGKDYPIGNDVIPYIFDNICSLTVQQFIDSNERLQNTVPRSNATEREKSKVLGDILSHIFEPAIEYDPQSYNYRISRREIGNLVRTQIFRLTKGVVHVIGPEMESVKDIVMNLYDRNGKLHFIFYTINTSKKTTYKAEQARNKREKLKFSHTLIAQRKNQNNFFKGLIYHLNNFGIPSQIIYIGSFPSFWLESIKWLPQNIHCYDPKWRDVSNDKVIWHQELFTLDMVDQFESGCYVYVDIRTDIRDDANKEAKLIEEDELNVSVALAFARKNSTVLFKRKIFEGINVTYNEPLFHPKLLQLGREYYNCINKKYQTQMVMSDDLYDALLAARYNNIPNYVYGGHQFTKNSVIKENETVIALYSLSNAVNALETIQHAISFNHFITFPSFKDDGDWRNVPEINSNSFQSIKKQLEFADWAINPKEYVLNFNVELMSESVFLQIGQSRAIIPDLYNHLLSIRYEMPLFFSDRYFAHIGIRQPSIFKRDSYMTSRLSAYISRQLTHSIDLSGLKKNHFEGYSGHLISIETSFNSLVYTMSPFRWLIRAKSQLSNKRNRDKFRIGEGQPHTREEFENTYEYLKVNNLIINSFQKMLLDQKP